MYLLGRAARGPSAEWNGFIPTFSRHYLQRALRASDTYRAIFIRPAPAGLDLGLPLKEF
jgi:hypothetical protein